ncbi:hypothetical protein TVAG_413030 [Trichomonas vaginalis G3]|uniref:Uncharacterized protein n=1 Tax=Trichomonas vaginalis (strain ATCC PRA-98 / G3) TaxID=412133 RepID=A2F6I8_TRIV3|nr:hypothetical protein TVAGG3_0002150 [Trichomonas vaginalis G3]EAX99486.1 hypothetical protein TVAG_413030 [Trichomonas vaginalis G3]KAI5538689.1 hypothetical protein TVAGG3_0002150 [Trichomonas vaginalis G3]|eukprot:XP_001312416.1 hypothetical protein [Trichomonas vaginalis G3]
MLYIYTIRNQTTDVKIHKYTLYILDVLVSEHNISRFYEEYYSWIRNLLKDYKNIILKVGATYEVAKFHTILYNHSNVPHIFFGRQRTFDYIYPFINGLEDFLNNTDFRWFLRTTDDVFINLEKLDSFLDDLEDKFDPLSDYIVRGSLAGVSDQIFLHGGPGWLMSRFAAQKYLEDYRLNPPQVERTGDDVVSSKYFRGKIEDYDCPQFYASPLNVESLELINRNSDDFPPCLSNSCKYPANLIAVWHSGEPLMEIVKEGPRLQFADDICLESENSGRSYLCKLNNETI